MQVYMVCTLPYFSNKEVFLDYDMTMIYILLSLSLLLFINRAQMKDDKDDQWYQMRQDMCFSLSTCHIMRITSYPSQS